ncbi:uncharacterized protein LOC143883243 [Tasmannia lanceolata]|uniref:uncharacterized protein LOC143883243 n=1 Tax=Tasmannia lanceolata TaxID=3420 RepID=UPI0040637475
MKRLISYLRRGQAVSNVSKSVSALDLSGKEKTATPPRLLSIPAKSSVNPLPRPVSSITLISEIRTKKSTTSQGNCDTPASDASKSTNRRKFSVFSSVSYWISQIKISESAAKHSISLGFFKLALESGCEVSAVIIQTEKDVFRGLAQLRCYSQEEGIRNTRN